MYLGTPPLNITQFQYSQYCHDATWTLAYALNRTLNSKTSSSVLNQQDCLHFSYQTSSDQESQHDRQTALADLFFSTGLNDNETNREVAEAFNTTQPFRLEDFTYSNRKLMDIMIGHLSNTSFNGITVMSDQLLRKA